MTRKQLAAAISIGLAWFVFLTILDAATDRDS